MVAFAPSTAHAISLIPTGTVASPISVEISGSLFARARYLYPRGGPGKTDFALTRARIGVDFRWKEYLHVQIEPDFAEDATDLADVYLEMFPIREVGVLLGRAKVPYGALELESRWRLPSLSRGLLDEIITQERGIGGRRVGAKASLRLKDMFLEPGIDVGAYRDSIDSEDTDFAVRVEIEPYLKGSEISLAGYTRRGIAADLGYGYAGALAFTYDKNRVYLVVEGMVLRGAALTPEGPSTTEDATLYGARLLAAYAFKVDQLRIQPFLGLEVVDTNTRTRSDVGGAVRGGLNLIVAKVLRFGAEFDFQRGQFFFPQPDRSTVTLFVGVFLE